MQTHEWSCLLLLPVLRPGTTRVPSVLLCYTLPVLVSSIGGTFLRRERQCTRKRQGKVHERQVWNVGTWLKNVSGSTETP
jgi:hypothetical protein